MSQRPDDPANDAYTTSLSDAEVETVRRWHARAMAELRAGDAPRTFEYLGLSLVVPVQVMPITPVSHLLGEAVLAEARPEDRVLDMGTGSGVNAILAARHAPEVLAVDINPYAVEAARANAARNGVADRISADLSDIFTNVAGRFDLIIFDPPFRWFTPEDHIEMAAADPGYVGLTAFFRDAHRHLTETGRMLIFFGTSGDLAYLHARIDEAGFHRETVATLAMELNGVTVEYFTYRLTRP
jgi:release factor glutamine methyltransferase